MIRAITYEELPDCARVIRESFLTVADELGLTRENAPGFTAFSITEERLAVQLMEERRPMYGYFDGGELVGFYSLSPRKGAACELGCLSVLPAHRHKGIGRQLTAHACRTARALGCLKIHIGIVEENTRLRRWYQDQGFVHLGTQKLDRFPFTCGYLEKAL